MHRLITFLWKDTAIDKQTLIKWRLTDVIVITCAILILFLGTALAIQYYFSLDGTRNITIQVSLLLGILESVFLIGGVYFLGLKRRQQSWTSIGLRKPNASWTAMGGLIGIIAIPLSALIAIGIQFALGKPIENPQLPFLVPDGFSWFGAISMFLVVGLLAPFAEELYFRGVLYLWMGERWGIWVGILLSSVFFAIVHGEVSVAGAAFGLGIILAWAYERSGSLWVAIMIHAINNSFKIILLYTFLGFGNLI